MRMRWIITSVYGAMVAGAMGINLVGQLTGLEWWGFSRDSVPTASAGESGSRGFFGPVGTNFGFGK